MYVLRPTYTNLADFLIVSQLTDIYTAGWRHHLDVKVEILFEEYIRLVLSEKKMVDLFSVSISSISLDMRDVSRQYYIDAYRSAVKDVALAQAVEILRAGYRNKPATTIALVPPSKLTYKVKPQEIPRKYILQGKHLLKDDLARKYRYPDEVEGVHNKFLYDNTVASYALLEWTKDIDDMFICD